jgi:hypothetical protein
MYLLLPHFDEIMLSIGYFDSDLTFDLGATFLCIYNMSKLKNIVQHEWFTLKVK